MKFEFTNHALGKFKLFEKYNFKITGNQVLDVIKKPDRIEQVKGGRKIAQTKISNRHVLRVIYEEHEEIIKVIAFYPAMGKRYED